MVAKCVSDARYRYDWLINQYDKVCFFEAAGKSMALIGTDKVPQELILRESIKIPLWKQAMALNMGQIPRTSREYCRQYRPMIIKHPEHRTFEIWQIE